MLLAGPLGNLSMQAKAQGGQKIYAIGPWTAQTDYGATSGNNGTTGITILGVSCVTNSSYVYCVGGQNLKKPSNQDISNVYFAQASPSGTLGGWTETTDYGATSGASGSGGLGIEWPSCVQWDSYVYCVGGATNSGSTSDVFYAQLSSSGVGPWTETTDYGASSIANDTGSGGIQAFQLACVAEGGYIYCVGGGAGSKTFYAQLSSTGVGPWQETTNYGASAGNTGVGGVTLTGQACTVSDGDIYCVGGFWSSPV